MFPVSPPGLQKTRSCGFKPPSYRGHGTSAQRVRKGSGVVGSLEWEQVDVGGALNPPGDVGGETALSSRLRVKFTVPPGHCKSRGQALPAVPEDVSCVLSVRVATGHI